VYRTRIVTGRLLSILRILSPLFTIMSHVNWQGRSIDHYENNYMFIRWFYEFYVSNNLIGKHIVIICNFLVVVQLGRIIVDFAVLCITFCSVTEAKCTWNCTNSYLLAH
jgi:hypothetical protein